MMEGIGEVLFLLISRIQVVKCVGIFFVCVAVPIGT